MTVFYLRRVGNTLAPEGDESICELIRLPFSKSLRAEIKQPRNSAFHRLFFALCARIGNSIGKDAEVVAMAFKLGTGHYEVMHSKKHGEIRIPKSISFAKMDEGEFRKFFDACIIVAFEEWGIDPSAVADLIDPKTEKRA